LIGWSGLFGSAGLVSGTGGFISVVDFDRSNPPVQLDWLFPMCGLEVIPLVPVDSWRQSCSSTGDHSAFVPKMQDAPGFYGCQLHVWHKHFWGGTTTA
ncbi:hypothetical protein, partial [Bifidobacterium sp. UBA6881]|uniref:hypothetical protein n=1 Tax=Bifidobacterium sp. UBA6881 TaxID=1946109 RepID=UPI0025C5CC71